MISVLWKIRVTSLAILQVIDRQRRFVFMEAAIDLVHPIPRVVNGFTFTQQFAGHGLQ